MRSALSAIAQTAAAAGVAWWLARALLPEPRPVFAPLAAIVALGATRGERGSRALQVSLGVAVGIGAAELVVSLLSTGTLQLALVTAVALTGAVFLFEAPTLIIQAGVSGALVVAIGSSPQAVGAERFLEALVGTGVALVVSQGLFPVDAVGSVRRAACEVLSGLADGLDRGAQASTTQDQDDLRAAQRSLREANLRIGSVEDGLRVAHEAARVARAGRKRGARLRRLDGIGNLLGTTVSAAEALVRAGGRLGRGEHEAPHDLTAALETLADLARQLADDLDRDDDALLERAEAATAHATAARRADPRPTTATAATLARSVARGLLDVGGVDAATSDRRLVVAAESASGGGVTSDG